MRSVYNVSRLTNVHLTVAIILLAGVTACSSNSSTTALAPTASQASVTQVRARTANCPSSVLYVISSYSAEVKVYDRMHLHADACGSIGGFNTPEGLFVDQSGNLWVADAGAKQIFKFAPGSSTPSVTLGDPNGLPQGVTVDQKSGNVYVSDYQNTDATTVVEVYAGGSTMPTGALHDPAGRNGGYVAVDNKGNVYATFMTQSNTAQVDRWTGGSGDPQNLGLKVISDGGIVTTRTGDLAICDPFGYRCGIYVRGSKNISHIFGHMGRGGHRRGDMGPDKQPWLVPVGLAIDRAEKRAYVTSESLTFWRFPGPENRPNHRPSTEIKVPGLAGDGIAIYPPSRPGAPY